MLSYYDLKAANARYAAKMRREREAVERLANKLRAAKEAHSAAFADGEPEGHSWPDWYARHILGLPT